MWWWTPSRRVGVGGARLSPKSRQQCGRENVALESRRWRGRGLPRVAAAAWEGQYGSGPQVAESAWEGPACLPSRVCGVEGRMLPSSHEGGVGGGCLESLRRRGRGSVGVDPESQNRRGRGQLCLPIHGGLVHRFFFKQIYIYIYIYI